MLEWGMKTKGDNYTYVNRPELKGAECLNLLFLHAVKKVHYL